MNQNELYSEAKALIYRLVAGSGLNSVQSFGGAIFGEPLVGVADGADPLFGRYKRIIGDYYMTPAEAIGKVTPLQPEAHATGDMSVVCWVLPWTEPVREANRSKTTLPASPTWSRAQEQGEKLNNLLREQVSRFFRDCGYIAAAPMHAPLYSRFGRYLTNWSERHALYAAGLGTFGLSQWFITERGVAMRCGSVVVAAALPPTLRRYRSHTENCLFYSDGSCRKCIDRCPAEAITVRGLDKAKCREYLDEHAKTEGCGLCQTNVPCEEGVPAAISSWPAKASEIGVATVGLDSIDVIEPLWHKLRRYHEGRSPHFPEHHASLNWPARREQLLEASRNGVVHIDLARTSDRASIVGYCVSAVSTGREGVLESIYLEPAYRHNSVGDELMRRALAWMDEQGALKRTLTVGVGNEEVLSFYGRYGFYPKHITVEQVIQVGTPSGGGQ